MPDSSWDILPRILWHNVHMADVATANPSFEDTPFVFDWRDIERGVPLAALDDFATYSAIPARDLVNAVIPPRTLKHRRQRKEPLSPEESDRLARVAKMYELAVKVYGNREDGRGWLLHPTDRFEGRTPLSLLKTEAGERSVEEFLYQIDEGVFA